MTVKKSTDQAKLLDIEPGTPNSRVRKAGSGGTQDHGIYRELSKPFLTADDANEAARGFFEAIGAARREWGIPDVLIITQITVMSSDGSSEGNAQGTMMYGDPMNAEVLSAFAYGQEQQRRRDIMSKLLKGQGGQRDLE